MMIFKLYRRGGQVLMGSYIKNELKRAIFSKNSLIVFIVTLVLYIFSFYNFANVPGFNLREFKQANDSLDVFIYIRKDALGLILPLLAAFIFSDSYLLDTESGFINSIYLRISKKEYVTTKILVNALASGIIIAITSSIISIFLIVMLGIHKTNLNTLTGPFSYIYYQSRVSYLILLIINSFIFNAIFATLALGVSPWIKNRYLTVLSSFFYYLISGTLFGYLHLFKLNGSILFTLNPIASEIDIIVYQLVLFIVGALLFYIGVLWKNEKNN